MVHRSPTFRRATLVTAALLVTMTACTAGAQEKPATSPPHDMEHMQHSHDGGFMQGGMHHVVAKGVSLDARLDVATRTIILREGPMSLPANTSHMKMPQPPDVYWTIDFDGWILSYAPKLVDANGQSVPGSVLHHTAFWNTNRADFLCPNKEEHIFGAGGELTNWMQVPGYGYRVQKGDKIRIETMVHNPTAASYDRVYLEVSIPYQDAAQAAGFPLKNYYPAWMDAKSCGGSGYDLPAGQSEKSGTVRIKYSGVLLGVGGHMHDHAKQLVLENATRKETVATLPAKVDAQGHLLSMPTVLFFDRGGYKFSAGDVLKIDAAYDNTTGKPIPDGAMGIVVGYFVPAADAVMAALRRHPKPAAPKAASAKSGEK
ncbi:MAG TPA: hypothetical protein VN780_07080 [Candidatus Eisenbacteria bacterium]|nr:hypothetical protein [Candidatus Eisenbacteria bacterium]